MRTLALALLGVSLVALPAAAQDQEAAREAFAEAQRHYEAGNYQLALEGFERSRALLEGDPERQSVMLFNIGKSLEQLGRYVEAVAIYQRYLVEAPGEAPFRQETQDRIRELEARLAATTSEQAPGDEPPATATTTTPSASEDSPLVPVGIAVLAVGGAAALVSIPVGVVALDGASTLEQRCPGGDCAPSDASLIDETHALSIATDVLWVSGLSIAALGAVLLAVGLTSSGDGVEASAACLPDRGCQAAVRGRF